MASDLGDRLAAAALECVGTPFHHGGRLPGVGLDCVGLVVVAGRECGLEIEDQPHYSIQDDNIDQLMRAVDTYCQKVWDVEDRQPGDIALFRHIGGSRPLFNHVGVVTPGGFVHAWNTPSVASVVETPFDKYWLGALAGVFRWRDA